MYEIYAYGNNETLYGIFQAMAAIMGSSTYLSAMALVIVAGFVGAGIAYAFAPEKLIGWKWLASVIVVYAVLFIPKVSVGIVDKLGTQPVQVVSNVPFGAAVFGHLTSAVGNTLTGLFETAFQVLPGPGQMPADLTYQKHGLLFGNKLVKETRGLVFRDPEFRTDMINFIHNCTMFDLADGTVSAATFSRSTDVWSLMGNPNPARFSTVTGSGTVDSRPCPDVYRSLSNRIPAQINDLNYSLAVLMNPSLPAAVASTEIGNQVWAAYTKANLAGAAGNAADIIRQNAVINAINDTTQIIGQKINDPSSIMLAVGRAQATAQLNASWINFGKMAEEALPLIRNSLEAIIYAVFPFVILLLFFTHGIGTLTALKSYLIALIWIQLWPPVYAILNYTATIASAKTLAAAADMGAGAKGMALQTISPVFSGSVSAEAVVGYLLCVALPAVAWAVVKGIDTIGQSNITGIGSLQSMAAGATGSAVSGNLNLGNVAMDQTALAPTRTSPYMRKWQDDVSGHTYQDNIVSGRRAVSLMQNDGYVSMTSNSGVSSALEERMSRSIEAAQSEAVASAQERSAVLAESVSKGREHLDSKQLSDSYSRAEASNLQENYSDVRSLVQNYAKRIGKDEGTTAQLMFDAAANIGVGSSGGGSKLGVGAGGGLNQRYSSGLSRAYDDITQNMNSEQAAQINAYANRFEHDQQFRTAIVGSDKSAQDLSARMQHSVSRSERAETALRAVTGFAEDMRFGESKEDRSSIDVLRDPSNWRRLLDAAENYGTSHAQRVIVDNMLAESSVLGRPTRGLRGDEVNWNRSNVADQHARDLNASNANADIDGTFKTMRSKVGADVAGVSATPEFVGEVGNEIMRQRSVAGATFDARGAATDQAGKNFQTVTGLVKTEPEVDNKGVGNPDGVLRSKRNLANDARDLFAEDVKESVANATEGMRQAAEKARGLADRLLKR